MENLFQSAAAIHSRHPTTKTLDIYQKYDDFISHHLLLPKSILEIGTFQGESTKVISNTFPEAKILTLDLNLRDIDFSNYKNVTYEKADQSNPNHLIPLITKHFPMGIDLVIEDASHIGYLSKITFDIVFPFLKSGGAYFIEDWATGYWDSWIDGSRFQIFHQVPHNNNIPKRIPSHDFGMVGFVKSLVDLTQEEAIKNNQHDVPQSLESRIKVLEFRGGCCMLLKS